MNGESARKVLDWCEKREMERVLATELNRTQEAVRMADVLAQEAWESTRQGVLSPDSNLMVKQTCQAVEEARQEYAVALARWKQFVIYGKAPQKLDS